MAARNQELAEFLEKYAIEPQPVPYNIVHTAYNYRDAEFFKNISKQHLRDFVRHCIRRHNLDILEYLDSIDFDLELDIVVKSVGRGSEEFVDFMVKLVGKWMSKGYDKTHILIDIIDSQNIDKYSRFLNIKNPDGKSLSVYNKSNWERTSPILHAFQSSDRNFIAETLKYYDINEDNSDWINYVKRRIQIEPRYRGVLPTEVFKII